MDLENKIKELEAQIDTLIGLKKNTYIHETHHLYCEMERCTLDMETQTIQNGLYIIQTNYSKTFHL